MGKSKVSGPGKLGSMKAVKQSLKKGGQANVKIIPKEDSITVRFMDDPDEFHGYYEHYVNGKYQPCVTDECEGCESDNPEERKKMFRYLANAYVVDDQKVWAVKLPKTVVEQLVEFCEKYGTLKDRDYDLKRTGSGQNDTKYSAIPDSPSKMKMERFEKKRLDLEAVLDNLINLDEDEDEEDEPPKKKKKKDKDKPKKSSEPDPWEDDEPPANKKKSKSGSGKTVVKKKRTVKRK